MGAIASSWSNEEIKENLEEFIAFLEEEIAKKSGTDKRESENLKASLK